jgi:hypothetical protein
MVGSGIVLFSKKSPNDDIFLELRLTVSHGSLLTQIVVVQLPFSHFVDILVCNRVSVDDRIALGNKTMVEQITNTETTIAGIIISGIMKNRNFIFTLITYERNSVQRSRYFCCRKFFMTSLRSITNSQESRPWWEADYLRSIALSCLPSVNFLFDLLRLGTVFTLTFVK